MTRCNPMDPTTYMTYDELMHERILHGMHRDLKFREAVKAAVVRGDASPDEIKAHRLWIAHVTEMRRLHTPR